MISVNTVLLKHQHFNKPVLYIILRPVIGFVAGLGGNYFKLSKRLRDLSYSNFVN